MTDGEKIEALLKRVEALEAEQKKTAVWLAALSADIVKAMAVLAYFRSGKRDLADAMLDDVYENYYRLNPDMRPSGGMSQALGKLSDPIRNQPSGNSNG